ncbi:hypothetical protein B0H10DRAFT_2014226, partial [Mycena sp. CBHHK59/15]
THSSWVGTIALVYFCCELMLFHSSLTSVCSLLLRYLGCFALFSLRVVCALL